MRNKILALSALTCIAGAFSGGVTQSQSRAMRCEVMVGSDCFEPGAQRQCEGNSSLETMTCSNGYWTISGSSPTIEKTW